MSAERGWFEFNPSVDGLGFVINRDFAPGDDLVDQIVDHEPDPDVVIVTMGLNDNFAMPADADDIEAAIDADLERFRAELPDARLVVVEPFWHQDERPDSVEQIIGWVEAAAERVGADYIAAPRAGSKGIPSGWPPTPSTRTTRATPRSPGAWTRSSSGWGSERPASCRSRERPRFDDARSVSCP